MPDLPAFLKRIDGREVLVVVAGVVAVSGLVWWLYGRQQAAATAAAQSQAADAQAAVSAAANDVSAIEDAYGANDVYGDTGTGVSAAQGTPTSGGIGNSISAPVVNVGTATPNPLPAMGTLPTVGTTIGAVLPLQTIPTP